MRFWDSSALARRRREDALAEAAERDALANLEPLRAGWHEMLPGEMLRAEALRALRLHPLRTADALQLAAALEWAGSPGSGGMVCFDGRIGEAAAREAFRVLGG